MYGSSFRTLHGFSLCLFGFLAVPIFLAAWMSLSFCRTLVSAACWFMLLWGGLSFSFGVEASLLLADLKEGLFCSGWGGVTRGAEQRISFLLPRCILSSCVFYDRTILYCFDRSSKHRRDYLLLLFLCVCVWCAASSKWEAGCTESRGGWETSSAA